MITSTVYKIPGSSSYGFRVYRDDALVYDQRHRPGLPGRQPMTQWFADKHAKDAVVSLQAAYDEQAAFAASQPAPEPDPEAVE